MPTQEIHGTVAPGFEGVRKAFAANLEEGREIGASFAVWRDGEALVDLWGGHADAARTRAWERDTLANVWSTTKGMAALCCAVLVDRGVLDYDAPVADTWPEFGDLGKEAVTVGMLLSHQAGLSATRERVTPLDYVDPDRINALLLAQEPLFEPGSASGYHALTFGPLVGELVRRATGESLGSFFQREIAAAVGADFYIGLPESEEPRVAEMVAPPASEGGTAAWPADANEVMRLALGNPGGSPLTPNDRAWRAAEIPSANGQGCAWGLAKVYSVCAAGGQVDGVRLLSQDTLARATALQIDAEDLVLPVPLEWGCGFIRNNFGVIYGPNKDAYGHSGYGGSFGYADPVTGVGVGYVMNQMATNLAGDPRSLSLLKALYEAL